MYGAILGDIIGSPFEFDRGNKSKKFELFSPGAEFTDDTVMTIAVCEGLLDECLDCEPEVQKSQLIHSLKKWGRKYLYAGYGARFRWWLLLENPEAYGSYGNGSAMRVSSVAWLYDPLECVREMARLTAEITHNHPEGIKGAEATASAIFLARTGHTKAEIKEYIVTNFGYDLSRTCDEIRPSYQYVESCQETVPEAITTFLETLFIITTDGMENASRRYGYEKVKLMIERQKKRYGWEFLFLGANMDAVSVAGRFGIDRDRAVRFHCDERGTELNYRVLSETITNVRCGAPMAASWKEEIEADYECRK